MKAKVLTIGVIISIIGLFPLLRPDLTRMIYDYGEGGYYEFDGILIYPSLFGISILFLGILISIVGLASSPTAKRGQPTVMTPLPLRPENEGLTVCPHCSSRIPVIAQFCPQCGELLSGTKFGEDITGYVVGLAHSASRTNVSEELKGDGNLTYWGTIGRVIQKNIHNVSEGDLQPSIGVTGYLRIIDTHDPDTTDSIAFNFTWEVGNENYALSIRNGDLLPPGTLSTGATIVFRNRRFMLQRIDKPKLTTLAEGMVAFTIVTPYKT